MERNPRKLIPRGTESDQKTFSSCVLCFTCPDECYMSPPPPPPPLLPPPRDGKQVDGGMSTVLIIILCVLGGALVFLSYFTILRFRSSLRRGRRRRDAAESPETGEDSMEGLAEVVDHPIWHIRTVGLPQSVIESISVFRYVKGDGLIEGKSDCSICLSEFKQDEMLRLLPKCSHAFHSPCIDKWLRAQKNCPICRAPILSSSTGNTVAVAVTSVESRPPEENENPPLNQPETEAHQTRETSGVADNTISLRVLSDLTDHSRKAKQTQVTRSSSMDNLPLSYRVDLESGEEGCSDKRNSAFIRNLSRSLKRTHQ